MNLTSASINLQVLNSDTISMCMARVVKHTKKQAYILVNFTLRYRTHLQVNGPARSTPTISNGRVAVTQSRGRSPIIWVALRARKRIHKTHVEQTFLITRFSPFKT